MEETKIKRPPTRSGGKKGSPPTEPSSNLERPIEEPKEQLGFRVPASFKHEYKTYASRKRMKMTELLIKSFEEYKQRNL